ncbi:MAG: transposase [bacterium]
MRHKNSPKRIYLKDAIYFVTAKTKGNTDVFDSPSVASYLLQVIRCVEKYKHCHVFAYVLLPNHLHVLLQPKGKYTVSDFMHFVKRHFSRNIHILLRHRIVGEDGHPRLRRDGVWQSSFHDHLIRNQRDFNTHIEYIRHNPVKYGIAKPEEHYPFVWVCDDC